MTTNSELLHITGVLLLRPSKNLFYRIHAPATLPEFIVRQVSEHYSYRSFPAFANLRSINFAFQKRINKFELLTLDFYTGCFYQQFKNLCIYTRWIKMSQGKIFTPLYLFAYYYSLLLFLLFIIKS